MATQTKHQVCRTYMNRDRAQRVAKQLNAAQHTGIGADCFVAVMVSPIGPDNWVIEIQEDGAIAGWVVL